MDDFTGLPPPDRLQNIIAIAGTALVFCVYLFLSYRHRREKLLTLRAAIERGIELTPERLAAMGLGSRGPQADLRVAVLCLSLAVGFLCVGLLNPDPGVFARLSGGAALLGVIGLAFIALWRIGSGRQR